jgi:sugar/nucleoside kinase (ribokinase family)
MKPWTENFRISQPTMDLFGKVDWVITESTGVYHGKLGVLRHIDCPLIEDVVDTTGAGDILAGVVVGSVEGHDRDSVLRLAMSVAGFSLSGYTSEPLERLLEGRGS